MQPRIIKLLHKHLHSLVLFAALHIFFPNDFNIPHRTIWRRPVKPLLPPGNTKENQTNKCAKLFPRKDQILLANCVSGFFRWHVFVYAKMKMFEFSVGFVFAKMTINPLSLTINQTNDTVTKRTLNDTKWFLANICFCYHISSSNCTFLPTKCFEIAPRGNSILRPKLSLWWLS